MARGKVVSMQICVGHREPMLPRDSALATTGKGLHGDRHANPEAQRQILLMDQEILDTLNLTPGTIRENITISGLPIHRLPVGQQLQIGTQMVLEVTGLCKPCPRMDEIRDGLQTTLEGQRGVLTRTIQGGELTIGDAVTVITISHKG